MAKKYESIAQKLVAPMSTVKQVKLALAGTKVPVGPGGMLRLMLFKYDIPMGEVMAVPHSTRFDPDYLVTWGTWYFPDRNGQHVALTGAYHYCIKAFKCVLPVELSDILMYATPVSEKASTVKYYTERDREKVYKAFEKYNDMEPWRTAQRDTPLLQALLTKKGALEKTYSPLERDLQALSV